MNILDDTLPATDLEIEAVTRELAEKCEPRVYGTDPDWAIRLHKRTLRRILNRLAQSESALVEARKESEWRGVVVEIEYALAELDKLSPPDDWEDSGSCGYNSHGKDGDVNFIDEPDDSNNGDVHSHGWDCGRWAMNKNSLRPLLAKLRALLAPSNPQAEVE